MLALVVVAAAAIAGYRSWRHQPRFILAIEPVGDGRAIVCARERNDLFASATWIGLFDTRSASWRWTRELSPDATDEWFDDGHAAVLARVSPREGLLVHDGRATIRVPGDAYWTKGVISAYGVDDGELLWRNTIDGLASGDSYFDVTAAGDKVLVGAGNGATALDAATGKELWHAPLDYQERSRVSLSMGVMTGDNGKQAWMTDLSTGARQAQATDGRSCVHDGELLFFDALARTPTQAPEPATTPTPMPEDRLRLMARRLDNGKVRVVVSELTFPGLDARPSLWGCGRYRDRSLVMIGFALDAPDALLEVDLAAGRQLAFTPLRSMQGQSAEDAVMQDRLANEFPENDPWTGALPRYVPLLMAPEGAVSLAIVDLEERRVIRRGPPAENLQHALVMRHGDSFTIAARDKRGTHTLARLDGETGTLKGAACTERLLAPMKPFDRHGDELWVHTDEVSMPLAMLQGDALVPTFSRKLLIDDCRARMAAAWFGP